jgi:hypothetical protein
MPGRPVDARDVVALVPGHDEPSGAAFLERIRAPRPYGRLLERRIAEAGASLLRLPQRRQGLGHPGRAGPAPRGPAGGRGRPRDRRRRAAPDAIPPPDRRSGRADLLVGDRFGDRAAMPLDRHLANLSGERPPRAGDAPAGARLAVRRAPADPARAARGRRAGAGQVRAAAQAREHGQEVAAMPPGQRDDVHQPAAGVGGRGDPQPRAVAGQARGEEPGGAQPGRAAVRREHEPGARKPGRPAATSRRSGSTASASCSTSSVPAGAARVTVHHEDQVGADRRGEAPRGSDAPARPRHRGVSGVHESRGPQLHGVTSRRRCHLRRHASCAVLDDVCHIPLCTWASGI